MKSLFLYTAILFGVCTFAKGHQLGSIVEKYESAGHPCVISNTSGDPGGKSYGLYQFSSDKGTMQKWIKDYAVKLDIQYYPLGSEEFDSLYVATCKAAAHGFAVAQRQYAIDNYYKPVRQYADSLNIPRYNAINEALFSIAIQHGRYKKIIAAAGKYTHRNGWLISLYNARLAYMWDLSLPAKIKQAIDLRYQLEIQYILDIRETLHATY